MSESEVHKDVTLKHRGPKIEVHTLQVVRRQADEEKGVEQACNSQTQAHKEGAAKCAVHLVYAKTCAF